MIPTIKLLNEDLIINMSYNEGAIRAIKSDIPRGGYKWDKGRKAWLVHKSFLESVCEIMNVYFKGFSLDPSCDALFRQKPKERADIDDVFVREGEG